MKKVMLVVPTLNLGGGEKLVADIATNIDIDNFNVLILTFFEPKNTIIENQIREKNIRIISLDKKLGIDFTLFFKLHKIIKDEKPDIIHTHLNALQYLIFDYLIDAKITKIHTVHSIAEEESKGISRIISKLLFRKINVIPVAISEKVKVSLENVYNSLDLEVPLIHNGIDEERFRPKKNRRVKSSDEIVFVTVGRLCEVKNHIFMVNAFNAFLKTNHKSKLIIIGDGPEKNKIQAEIKRLDISDKVILKGITEKVEKYLVESDIFLMTSIYEGLPLSVIEALMCHIPVVAVDVGGISDIVQDKVNGLLTDTHSISDFASAMFDACYKFDFKSENFEYIRNKHSISKCTRLYEELYITGEI